MVSSFLNSITQMYGTMVGWFSTLLDATGGGNIYIAFVTIALSVSFLLARFGGFLSLGSDKAGAVWTNAMKGGGKYASGKFTGSRQKTGRFSPGVDRTTSISTYHRKK